MVVGTCKQRGPRFLSRGFRLDARRSPCPWVWWAPSLVRQPFLTARNPLVHRSRSFSRSWDHSCLVASSWERGGPAFGVNGTDRAAVRRCNSGGNPLVLPFTDAHQSPGTAWSNLNLTDSFSRAGTLRAFRHVGRVRRKRKVCSELANC